jgi:hypothetical protein
LRARFLAELHIAISAARRSGQIDAEICAELWRALPPGPRGLRI